MMQTMTRVTDVMIKDPRWAKTGLRDLAETASRATLIHLGIPCDGYEIAILGCDDAEIADLNGAFRDKPAPTNVLSWPSDHLAAERDGGQPDPPSDPDLIMGESLGDIALAYETCQTEAQAAGKTLADHTTHLIIHGVLHLLGYDHVRGRDATLMEGLETEILGKMGIADPYIG